jgi:exodeoxyribonuclease VII small subunit
MNKNELNYEEALNKLEALLEQLEDEGLRLDESVEKFKDAMELYSYCRSILTKAEGEVKMILEKDGRIQETDFADLAVEAVDESF